jgi:hypothetical protein
VKDCVDKIKYDEGTRNITVKYTTAEKPVEYPTNARWEEENGSPMILDEPGTYRFRIFEDRVVLGKFE